MTYEEFINNILETRGRNGCGDEYHERHHIVPKCMGGTNDKENLIDLFAREHFEAHRLLALENSENEKLVYAWWAMAHLKDKNQSRAKLSPEEYEQARKRYSEIKKNKPAHNKGVPMTEDQRKKLSESKKGKYTGENSPMYGKKHTEEAKEKMRKNHADYSGKNHPQYGTHLSEERKRSLREMRLGTTLSEETKRKIRESTTGELNHFYGKHHTQEARRRMSEIRKGQQFGVKNPNSKITIQFDLELKFLKSWNYLKQASEELHINKNSISSCCRGVGKTAGGFVWRYLYDYTKRDGTIIPGAITLGLITEEEVLKQLEKQNDLKGE